jgi:hypothetical protein
MRVLRVLQQGKYSQFHVQEGFSPYFQTFFLSCREVDKQAARACTACYDAVFPVIEASSAQPSSNTTSKGTLSSLPIWKTTKQNSFDSSVLRLLSDSASFNVNNAHESSGSEERDYLDSDLPGDNETFRISNSRGQRRFSSLLYKRQLLLLKPSRIPSEQSGCHYLPVYQGSKSAPRINNEIFGKELSQSYKKSWTKLECVCKRRPVEGVPAL